MRVALPLPLVCSLFFALEATASDAPATGKPAWVCWKRTAVDSGGRVLWSDSIFHDTAGKPLLERRRDARGSPRSSVRHGYDAHGLEVSRLRASPEDSEIASSRCLYGSDTGAAALDFWISRSDSLPYMAWSAGNRVGGEDSVLAIGGGEIRFAYREGRLARAGMRSPRGGGTTAEFAYDSLGRHAATRFFRRGGMRLGRDTIARDSAGRPTEWALRDSRGRMARREAWTWSLDGRLLESRSFRDSAVPAGGIRYAWATLDSAPIAAGMRSRFPGPAHGRPCGFEWTAMVPFAIEPLSLEGLFLDSGMAARGRPARPLKAADPDGLFPDEPDYWDPCQALEEDEAIDSCHERAEAARKAGYFGPFSRCLSDPSGPCADTLLAAVARLLDSIDVPELPEQALDSLAGVLIGRGPPDADRRLLYLIREESQRERLWPHLLKRLLALRVERGYAAFIAAGGPASLPERLPAGYGRPDTGAVGPHLAAAWEYRQRVLAIAPAPPPETGAREGMDQEACVRGVLAWMRSGDARDLRGAERQCYHFGNDFGEGAPEEPLEWARLAESLEAGRLGAVLRQTEDPELLSRLLGSRGLDWDRYLLGYLADPSDYRWRETYLANLARRGSPATAEILIGMPLSPYLREGMERGFALVLGALAADPGVTPALTASYLPDEPGEETAFRRDPAAGPLPPRLRARAMARMLAPLETDPYNCPAREILAVLAMEDLPGRAIYAARAAAIPEAGVRDSALALLRRLEPDRPPPQGLIPVEPARFRFISGGRPLAGLGLRINRSGEDGRPLETPLSHGRYAHTDQDGYCELDRMQYMRLLQGAWELAFSTADARAPMAPLFRARVEASEWPAGTVTVEVPLRKVIIVPVPPPGFIRAIEAKARLRVTAAYGDGEAIGMEAPWRDSLVFPAWGEGTYLVELSLPGLRTENLPPIRVAERDVVVRPRLSRGADVSVIVDLPDRPGEARLVGVAVVDRDGREWAPSETESRLHEGIAAYTGMPILFAGLAPGAYVLKVRSSRSLRASLAARREAKRTYAKRIPVPGTVPPVPRQWNHKALDFPFQVPAEGPDDLDLGRLHPLPDAAGEGAARIP